MMSVYKRRRCRRIVTTADAELTSRSADDGGETAPPTKTATVTRDSTGAAMHAQTAAITSRRQPIYRVLPGTFTSTSGVVR